MPTIATHARLMQRCSTRASPARTASATRLIAHPDAPPIERADLSGPNALAIGPEGGWIQRELDTFVGRGFQPVSIGTPILRVEPALAAALGQLLLLLRRG